MVLTVLGAVAELERSLIAKRVKAGLRNARVKGKRLGRPRVAVDAARIAALRAHECSWREITEEMGISEGAAQRAFCGLPATTLHCLSEPRELSYQQLADSFLAFLRRIFWSDHQPKVTEGVLATIWSLDQAIKTNPGGVGDPIQVMTLEKDGGDWKVKELGNADFSEHRQAISGAESALAEYRVSFKPAQGDTAPPKPA